MMSFDKLNDLLQAFEERIRRDLRLRCEAYAPDFEMPEVFNVLTALLARQATLAIEVSSAPKLWNPHSAPLFLRAMADVHIALAWILLDARTRVRQYLEHRLGQAVLQLEHLKKEISSADDLDQPNRKDTIESEQSWLMYKSEFSRRGKRRGLVWQDYARNARAGRSLGLLQSRLHPV
jgi:hypothetical protein